MKKGTILVTGGAGFIGSALICELNNRGMNDILVVDILGNDNKFLNLVPLEFCDYLEADHFLKILERKDALLNDLSCIIHLGACSSTTERDCSYLIRNNYEYTKALAHFAHKNNIRFIYASSAATYGDGSKGMSDRKNPDSSLQPLNMYGYSKHLFDIYSAKNGLKCYGLKYFNVFGPNEYHKDSMKSMVLKAYESISATGKVNLFKSDKHEYKDGEQKRDFLYVKDAVDMTLFFMTVPEFVNKKSTYGLYNIGSGISSTWVELVSSVFHAMRMKPNINFVDMPTELKNKYQYETQADISKLREIGYTKEITLLKDAIFDYVTNYLFNEMSRLSPKN